MSFIFEGKISDSPFVETIWHTYSQKGGSFISLAASQSDLLVFEPVVEAAIQGQFKDISLRSIQRRFRKATGLTYKAVCQIERARQALALLQQGESILDTVCQTGYFDQPHLTKSLKYLTGQTPAQIARLSQLA